MVLPHYSRGRFPHSKPENCFYLLRLELQVGLPCTLGVTTSSEEPNFSLHTFSANALVAKLFTQPKDKNFKNKAIESNSLFTWTGHFSLVSTIQREGSCNGRAVCLYLSKSLTILRIENLKWQASQTTLMSTNRNESDSGLCCLLVRTTQSMRRLVTNNSVPIQVPLFKLLWNHYTVITKFTAKTFIKPSLVPKTKK